MNTMKIITWLISRSRGEYFWRLNSFSLDHHLNPALAQEPLTMGPWNSQFWKKYSSWLNILYYIWYMYFVYWLYNQEQTRVFSKIGVILLLLELRPDTGTWPMQGPRNSQFWHAEAFFFIIAMYFVYMLYNH